MYSLIKPQCWVTDHQQNNVSSVAVEISHYVTGMQHKPFSSQQAGRTSIGSEAVRLKTKKKQKPPTTWKCQFLNIHYSKVWCDFTFWFVEYIHGISWKEHQIVAHIKITSIKFHFSESCLNAMLEVIKIRPWYTTILYYTYTTLYGNITCLGPVQKQQDRSKADAPDTENWFLLSLKKSFPAVLNWLVTWYISLG